MFLVVAKHSHGRRLKSIPTLSSRSRKLSWIRASSSLSHCDTVVHIPRADVYRFGDGNKADPVFKELEWTVKDGENWAIVGPAGSEKSALLDMLLGYMRLSPPPSGGLYPFLYNHIPPLDPHDHISLVSFTARNRAAGGAFFDYTARYGAVRDEDRLTLRETLFAEIKSKDGIAGLEKLAERLDLKRLLDLPFIVLSNGQTRRARIAKALLGKPELLLLDEPLTGLDVQHRPKLTSLLHDIHESRKPRILMALRPQDPLPEWITHVASVEGQHVRPQSRTSFTPPLPSQSSAKLKTEVNEGTTTASEGKDLVVMKNVNVRYHDRHVLKDIKWIIKEGEKWHLQGLNGSGKTTLLSLLTGSHPQSYTQPLNNLRLFSSPRRHVPTITLQRLVGITSPEIFAAFPRRALTVREAIGTGFDGAYSYRVLTKEQSKRIDEVVASLGPSHWSTSSNNSNETGRNESENNKFLDRKFADFSPGEQSLALLMRALVSKPPLLILDEVFSGMDRRMVEVAQRYLREELDPKQAVVFVSHWEEEVPWDACAMRKIRIEDGVARIS
ncbi:P-loop containing nucleoside triphosphate hydrolase protein [Fomitiporia mediterranea MF3/22]|uniref:P-loop containing nucleoside triphosphate hydrolase protein n=1 Tax=Fomitiporia mediterranea (strain MF3/22) TaxID=694068 RepID=UPI00044082B9|nr:P-loop containing nucleoside triphosphate hydrolase protein [Fomitiporia mediterranea MF3/22]EJD08187.1 P-loop containing nucleoside triphosphate hydrolase protein [Fomitiporia mediterranea MF3/22]